MVLQDVICRNWRLLHICIFSLLLKSLRLHGATGSSFKFKSHMAISPNDLIISWNPATQHAEFDFNTASSNLKLKSQHSVARLGAKEDKCNGKTCSRMKDSSEFIQSTLDSEPTKALQGHTLKGSETLTFPS